MQHAAAMREHTLNLVLATALLGIGACSDEDATGPSIEAGMVSAELDGEAKTWSTSVAANDWQFEGMVVLYATNEDGQGVRLTMPNAAGAYACEPGTGETPSPLSVHIAFVETPGGAPAMTSSTKPECSIYLDTVGNASGRSWTGSFSGVLYRPDADLTPAEKRITLSDGIIDVSYAR